MAKDDETRLTRFREWLNEGVALVGECRSPGRMAELVGRHRVPISPLAAMRMSDFLDGLALALDPDVRSQPEPQPKQSAAAWADEMRRQRAEADRQAAAAQTAAMMAGSGRQKRLEAARDAARQAAQKR